MGSADAARLVAEGVVDKCTTNHGGVMTRILLLGYAPETVDYSDPALPPGMTAEKIHAAIAVAMKQFAERGWESDVCFIRPDETAGPTVERQLGSRSGMGEPPRLQATPSGGLRYDARPRRASHAVYGLH